jgi:hypothetical protein
MRDRLVRAVSGHLAVADVTSADALRDLRALEAATNFHTDVEATQAAALLHRARLAALPAERHAVDLVATVVLFSFLSVAAPALVPSEIQETLRRAPLPPPALGLGEWASLALEEALATQDRDGVGHALLLAMRASTEDGVADVRLELLELRARGHQALYQWTDDLDALDQAIELLREYAAAVPAEDPDYGGVWSNLGVVLDNRGTRLSSEHDLIESIECGRRAVAHAPSAELRARFLSNLASALESRAAPEDVEEAIDASREAVGLTAADDPARPIRLNNLGSALGTRHLQTGDTTLLQESIAALEEAVALTPPGDPGLERRKANLQRALAAMPEAPTPQEPNLPRLVPRRWRRSFTQALARKRVLPRPRIGRQRLAYRIDRFDSRYSAYRRTRPTPNFLLGMYEHILGGPDADARSAAALPPLVVGFEDIVDCVGEWLRRDSLWTVAGVSVLTVGLNAAGLSWGASGMALIILVSVDWLLIGRGRTIAYAVRFCPVGSTVLIALVGAAFLLLATLACLWAGVRPPSAALAASLGWFWTTTAVLTPAIAAELAFSRGERRRVALPPGKDMGGGVSLYTVRKDRALPMDFGPFSHEQEVLYLDGPSRDDWAPRRLEALAYARHNAPDTLTAAAIVSAPVAGVAALFLVLTSRLRLGVTLGCAAATGLIMGAEKLRLLVVADKRARDHADGSPPPSFTSHLPTAVGFAGGGQRSEWLLTPGNRSEGTAETESLLADRDHTDEVWS